MHGPAVQVGFCEDCKEPFLVAPGIPGDGRHCDDHQVQSS